MPIKLIIFDMDGVLVDAGELHYQALNRALSLVGEEYVIPRTEHWAIYDGLTTKRKLDLLTEKKNFPKVKHDYVWEKKQEFTEKMVSEELTYDERVRSILAFLSFGRRTINQLLLP